MIRFYTDEHISRATIHGLRLRGLDVLTTPEAGTRGAADEVHLERALAEGRVLVTQDSDFLKLHAEGRPHAGIVYAPRGTAIGDLVRGLTLMNEILDGQDMGGQVEYL
jgi:hypothetical protein